MSSKRILVVEDEPEHIEVLKDHLEDAGYTVLVAKNSYEALQRVRHSQPDLILLDLGLPGMSGEELLSELKDNPLTFHIPVIVITGQSDKEIKVKVIRSGVDDYLIKPYEPDEALARIEMVLYRYETIFDTNPLTRLPGNNAITRQIDLLINKGEPFSVCYCDIDHFKSFNDKYGYEKGNEVICQTALILRRALERFGTEHDFLGHIGGDDFVLITKPECDDDICQFVVGEFDRLIPLHYPPEARRLGFIEIEDRRGELQRFPLMSISIAVVRDGERGLENSVHVAEIAAELKAYLKRFPGSNYLHDRRGGGKTDVESPEEAREGQTQQHKAPLGQVLLHEGLVSENVLWKALRVQWRTGIRLGQILIDMGAVEPKDIGRILRDHLNIPYVDLDGFRPDPLLIKQVGSELAKRFFLLPIEVRGDYVLVAMADPFNKRAKRELEKKMGKKVLPLVALEQQLEKILSAL